ncbi:MAG: hypothetical protein AAFY26_06355 [Cyanobacteria bacterium J06638_22]
MAVGGGVIANRLLFWLRSLGSRRRSELSGDRLPSLSCIDSTEPE